MTQEFRCDCPITSALDILGDRWILVIVKQMLIQGKETFKDFTDSDEAIATNILSRKLKLLQQSGIVLKTKRPDNKKTNLYLLTEKGLALTPIIVELAKWSDTYLRADNPEMADPETLELLRRDKAAFADAIEQQYRHKLASTDYVK